MKLEGLTPILNVSNIEESFAWFAKLGWEKAWDWGEPPTFGAVCNGKVEIFLCQGGQGSRGGPMPQFVGDDETPSTGAGEPGIVPIAAAISNAVFNQTGQRHREIPIQRHLR